MGIKTNDVFPLRNRRKMCRSRRLRRAECLAPFARERELPYFASMTFCSVNARFNAIFIAV